MNTTSGSLPVSGSPALTTPTQFVSVETPPMALTDVFNPRIQEAIRKSSPFTNVPDARRSRPWSTWGPEGPDKIISDLAMQHGHTRSTEIYHLILEALEGRLRKALSSDPNPEPEHQVYLDKLEIWARQRAIGELDKMWRNRDDWPPKRAEQIEQNCIRLAEKHDLPWPPYIEGRAIAVDDEEFTAAVWKAFEDLAREKADAGEEDCRVRLRDIYIRMRCAAHDARDAMAKHPTAKSEEGKGRTIWYWLP